MSGYICVEGQCEMGGLIAHNRNLEAAHRQIQATVDRLGGEVEQMRKTLDFVRTDPCFMYLGSVTQDTVTDALGLTSILANQQSVPEK